MKKEAFKFGEILLPQNVSVNNWAVVACDQHTSNPKYWDSLENKLTDPTSLKLIFPECYLTNDNGKRIASIIAKQNEYLCSGIFKEIAGTILVKRTTSSGNIRWGVMCLVNLSEYCPDGNSHSIIRATEGLVESRIPPRKVIRDNCQLELPHIMLLIDDRDKTVIEPLKGKGSVVYDGELNSNGGKITGYNITDTSNISAALNKLYESSIEKYGEPLLFLVGDGNHSLATAKACASKNNPLSQYALVEVVNIYDEGLKFEPIHRIIYKADKVDFVKKLKEFLASENGKTSICVGIDREEILFPTDPVDAFIKVQTFIDNYTKIYNCTIDYIHGYAELQALCANHDAIGIKMPSIDKNTFFDYIVKNGTLPRKTFSMGEAEDKRYYMEARRIR